MGIARGRGRCCQAHLQIGGKPSSKIKTAYKKDDLNPVWNHIGEPNQAACDEGAWRSGGQTSQSKGLC